MINPELVRYARVIVGDDAEDVVSETWLQLTRELARFRGDGAAFRSLALLKTRDRARDLLRRRKARGEEVTLPAEHLPEPRDTGADAAETVLEALSTEQAIAFIATLPRAQAEAVMLRVVLGMDAAGASAVLGRRQGAVRMAVSRGLRQLARTLERRGSHGAGAPDRRG
ncbi:RNA polymerase sigma factor [Streptomyces capparidis]